jgi:hypothetical protein
LKNNISNLREHHKKRLENILLQNFLNDFRQKKKVENEAELMKNINMDNLKLILFNLYDKKKIKHDYTLYIPEDEIVSKSFDRYDHRRYSALYDDARRLGNI